MDKLEMVIKGLECCMKDDCDNCPYYDPEVDHDCDYFGKCLRGNMYRDALALLKAQEPVEPKKKSFLVSGQDDYTSTPAMTVCGACDAWLLTVEPRAKYCPQCGKAVKWE